MMGNFMSKGMAAMGMGGSPAQGMGAPPGQMGAPPGQMGYGGAPPGYGGAPPGGQGGFGGMGGPFVCPRSHPMIDSVLYCSKCGRRAYISHSCYSCQYHLCVQCCADLTHVPASVHVEVKAEVKQEVKEEEKRPGGFPCHQCKQNSIVYGKVGSRQALCFRCKKTGHLFTYWCKNCDLDVCEPCAEEIKKEMKEMMGNFMSKGMAAMGMGGSPSQGMGTPQGMGAPPGQMGYGGAPPGHGGFGGAPPGHGGFGAPPGHGGFGGAPPGY